MSNNDRSFSRICFRKTRCRDRECRFAHHFKEFKPLICIFYNCNYKNCSFLHPHDTKKSVWDRQEVFLKKILGEKRFTCPCRSFLENGKCLFRDCGFAHSPEQYKKRNCSLGERCRSPEKCFYLHGTETPQDLFKRLLYSKDSTKYPTKWC